MNRQLNRAQRAAVENLEGPLLVLAGAGTGKTRVVTYRIVNLVRHGVPPQRILGVTFTNKAAREMQQRAARLLGRHRKQSPEISTFHSLCVRILRRHITRLGYPVGFTIYDRSDQESLARAALREMKISSAELRPADLIYWIGQWKTQAVRPPEAIQRAETDRQHLAASAYRRYQAALQAAGAVDFDDLLLLTEELLNRFAPVRRAEADRFDHVLVDEYQDTNPSQYRMVKALAGGHRNLCVVGDDDQAIYSWRGAKVEHILRFKLDWPDAKVVNLEKNYRSRPEILRMANTLITFNAYRHEKQLQPARAAGARPRILQLEDETEEARAVVSDIRRQLASGVRPQQIAILFRTNEQPRPLEAELRRAGLPYVLVGSLSFYDRREIRDILAYLKLIVAPGDDVSLLRIINRPPRGISQKMVRLLTEFAVQEGLPVWKVLEKADCVPSVTARAADRVGSFVRLVQHWQAAFAKCRSLTTTATDLVASLGYREELRRTYPDPNDFEARWQAVEQVINAIGSYQKQARQPTLRGFLDAVAIDDRHDADKEEKLQRNAIALMTLHAAKGLEFPHVYLVGLEEGLLPHRKSIEADEGAVEGAVDEERRLCYVGVTRAQDCLTLSMSLTRQKWGKSRDTLPSRFLYELTGQADHPKASAARTGRPPGRRAGGRAAAGR
ncbi:MAG: UvrD-helicase domain-containing protein [Planctomycetales bacterium]|nr:UvrD-helicase domain-containing protein [Planctomycetales bacterium]NIM10297.1 UvrD-helicase domain-containing protein [Planctomycetales bacterium]NIN09736.1 UvrD-helicase domain-containing protein [Planctomycetales bacterium]NIN78861.1 UvrD-helicase domain-containing protein [Planctomycetales bacterium]NIO36028.1 UvrD-helicase domain-containing protein [Planctomycetales bacterium]